MYVCVVDATGKAVVNGDYLEPGKSTKTFRSQRFRVNFGNGDVRMRVGGKRYPAADIGKPIGYEIRPGKKPARLVARPCASRLCATVSVRAGIVVTGTEVLVGHHPRRQRARGCRSSCARAASWSAHIVVVGDRPEDLRGALDFLARPSTWSSPAAGSGRPPTT